MMIWNGIRHVIHELTRPMDRAGPHYLFLILSGVSGLVWSPPSLKSAALIAFPFYVTMGSLIVGGILCSTGRWRGSHSPKIFGLILILLSLSTYLLALLTRWPESAVTVFFLLAFAWLLWERLRNARKSRDARDAVHAGSSSRSDLASYAVDSLASRRRDPRRMDWDAKIARSIAQSAGRAG